jgi:hypothetical protein
MTPEASLSSTPDVANSVAVSNEGSSSADSSTAPQATTDSSLANVQSQSVQDQNATQQTPDDPLAGLPSADELKALVAQNAPNAKGLAQLREAYEKRSTEFTELQGKWKTFEPVADKFSAPEEIQSLVDMREALLGWENQDGRLVPSTERFIQSLDPQRAEFLFADLADGVSASGEPRIEKALKYMAADPDRRANALKILGGVEPSAVAPQWQATEEQLAVVKPELQDTFKKLPYEKREALATNDPEFINDYLGEQKLKNDLIQEREQRAQQDQQIAQQREQMLQAEAQKAGDENVRTQLSEAMTTFHKSVVDQCKLIEPLDPNNPPQGMDAQAIAQYNQQAEASNKAEAATVTLAVVGLINEQTRPFVLPLLKEIGVIDDKFLSELDNAAKGFGDNARNYGHLTYQQKLRANGNGYQPGQDVTMLNNEAQRNRKLLSYYANQLSSRLLEKKGQTFGMKATGHNNILNGVAPSRPNANGGSYDPTKATAQTHDPQNPWPTRAELGRQYG